MSSCTLQIIISGPRPCSLLVSAFWPRWLSYCVARILTFVLLYAEFLQTMTVFSRPYSTTAANADRDALLAYAASSKSAAIYLLDSRAIAGALLVDPMLRVRVVVRPCVTFAPVPAGSAPSATPKVASVTFNSSDTHLAPVMAGPMAVSHVVLVDL